MLLEEGLSFYQHYPRKGAAETRVVGEMDANVVWKAGPPAKIVQVSKQNSESYESCMSSFPFQEGAEVGAGPAETRSVPKRTAP